MDTTAYNLGYFLGAGALLIIGLFCAHKAYQLLSAAPDVAWTHPLPPSPAVPDWGFYATTAPTTILPAGGTTLPSPVRAPQAKQRRESSVAVYVIASIVTLVGGASGIAKGVHQARNDAYHARVIVVPASLLGVDENAAETARLQSATNDPAIRVAAYGDGGTQLILLGRALPMISDSDPLNAGLVGYARGLEEGGHIILSQETDVSAGPLGGVARCWDVTDVDQHAFYTCAFVERGSLVATEDSAAPSLQVAASRGREVRSAVLH